MKHLLSTIFIALSFSISAQDNIYVKIAKETCDCAEQKNLPDASKNELETALGLCMLESVQNNDIDVDISDAKAMRKLGETVGIQMAPLCPSFFEAFLLDENEEPAVTTVKGKIKSIDENEFLFITVMDKDKKETRMIWLRHFKGSDEFLSNPKKLIGKKVTIKYQSINCYIPSAKGYYAYKEIIELEVK